MRQPAIPKLSELAPPHWRNFWLSGPPRLTKPPTALRSSRELLASALAWQLQERKFGGLSAATKRKLRVLARAHQRKTRSSQSPGASTNLRPGTLISKQWRGAEHVVTVLADGYQHQGTVYAASPEWPVRLAARAGTARLSSACARGTDARRRWVMRANKAAIRWCAVYTRKSSEEGLEQQFNSLHAQREAAEAYIKSQWHEGWPVGGQIR